MLLVCSPLIKRRLRGIPTDFAVRGANVRGHLDRPKTTPRGVLPHHAARSLYPCSLYIWSQTLLLLQLAPKTLCLFQAPIHFSKSAESSPPRRWVDGYERFAPRCQHVFSNFFSVSPPRMFFMERGVAREQERTIKIFTSVSTHIEKKRTSPQNECD